MGFVSFVFRDVGEKRNMLVRGLIYGVECFMGLLPFAVCAIKEESF